MCLSTAWAKWEGAHERMTPMEVFLTGGYPLAVLFFPYLLQTSHLPVAVPSSARLWDPPGMAVAPAALSPAFGIPRAGAGVLV